MRSLTGGTYGSPAESPGLRAPHSHWLFRSPTWHQLFKRTLVGPCNTTQTRSPLFFLHLHCSSAPLAMASSFRLLWDRGWFTDRATSIVDNNFPQKVGRSGGSGDDYRQQLSSPEGYTPVRIARRPPLF